MTYQRTFAVTTSFITAWQRPWRAARAPATGAAGDTGVSLADGAGDTGMVVDTTVGEIEIIVGE